MALPKETLACNVRQNLKHGAERYTTEKKAGVVPSLRLLDLPFGTHTLLAHAGVLDLAREPESGLPYYVPHPETPGVFIPNPELDGTDETGFLLAQLALTTPEPSGLRRYACDPHNPVNLIACQGGNVR